MPTVRAAALTWPAGASGGQAGALRPVGAQCVSGGAWQRGEAAPERHQEHDGEAAPDGDPNGLAQTKARLGRRCWLTLVPPRSACGARIPP